MISNDIVDNNDPFPFFGIELDRFIKVIKYSKLPLSKGDIINLAETSNWLRKYKFKNEDNQI
jgi:ribosome biogenesis GTPase A